MELDLDWDTPLEHRKGGETRLCGIDVFHDFDWLEVFPDERTQFRHGQCLANFVQEKCADEKTPALLLTLRDGLKQGFRHTPNFLVFVVNLREYRATSGDAARSYMAGHIGVDIAEIDQLQELAASADSDVVRAFVESYIDFAQIAAWASDNDQRLEQLREFLGAELSAPPSLTAALAAVGTFGDLSGDDLRLLLDFFGSASTREQRLELLRAVTADPSGRYVTGEVLAERTPQRIQDARDAMVAYQALLDDQATNETTMQRFIEQNLWLLGLDYAVMRPRKQGPSGATDFLLQRYDGFHDLLELKSPNDDLIKAPDIVEDDPVPPPHEYALAKTLAQALAQAMVYRDRLTRYADAAKELYGLPQTRDPRIVIVIGKADSMPEHRQRVLLELNKSLHRIEVVPYDVLAKRANAVLTNVEHYLLAAEADSAAADGRDA